MTRSSHHTEVPRPIQPALFCDIPSSADEPSSALRSRARKLRVFDAGGPGWRRSSCKQRRLFLAQVARSGFCVAQSGLRVAWCGSPFFGMLYIAVAYEDSRAQCSDVPSCANFRFSSYMCLLPGVSKLASKMSHYRFFLKKKKWKNTRKGVSQLAPFYKENVVFFEFPMFKRNLYRCYCVFLCFRGT